jgi:hypothetical protein
MNKLPFHGPKLKLARAKQHAAELSAKVEEYIRRDPFVLFVERANDDGRYYLAGRWRGPVPDEFSVVFGDAVHNLRTALDILANDLVALCGAIPKEVYFPFAKSADEIEGQIAKRMKGATSDIIDIVRNLKPYKGGDEILRALHDLDISDKHICLLGAGVATSVTPRFKEVPTERAGKSRTLVSDFSSTPTVQIDMTGFDIPNNVSVIGKTAESGPLELILVKKLPLGGRPALGALKAMIDKTQSVIETFEAHCLRNHHAAPRSGVRT